MGWNNDRFYYTKRLLKTIAENYQTIYDGFPVSLSGVITNEWAIAEYKADFDLALRQIGHRTWRGVTYGDFKYYRNYGRLQRIVIADILGITDDELHRLRFYDIPRLRGYAYYLMCTILNGGANAKNNA